MHRLCLCCCMYSVTGQADLASSVVPVLVCVCVCVKRRLKYRSKLLFIRRLHMCSKTRVCRQAFIIRSMHMFQNIYTAYSCLRTHTKSFCVSLTCTTGLMTWEQIGHKNKHAHHTFSETFCCSTKARYFPNMISQVCALIPIHVHTPQTNAYEIMY